MKKTIKNVEKQTVAQKLYDVQEQIKTLEELETAYKSELLENLKTQGVSFIKLDNGTTFTRSHRETLKVVDEVAANAWAQEHYCLKLDTTKAMAILRRELSMPAFFTRVIGEDYLTIKKHD